MERDVGPQELGKVHSTGEKFVSDATSPFVARHIGPSADAISEMVQILGHSSLDEFVSWVVPDRIRTKKTLSLGAGQTESEVLRELKRLAKKNQLNRSFIGLGYYGCLTPTVIERNIFENPGWYTQYTPYQAEIAQGRLEALLNFQTVVADLTGLPIANASLLDEGTAAAEAMALSLSLSQNRDRRTFFVSEECFPQTIAVIQTRAAALGVQVLIGSHQSIDLTHCFGALIQYPTVFGNIPDYRSWIAKARSAQVTVVMAADILALTLLTPPGELGADIAVGSTQRFGIPLGYGGPHAAFFATKDEYKRQIPGRIVGVSRDASGHRALRLALQTREQHIRREKATSNICTAQVLLAVMASMYAVYHGSEGLRAIADGIAGKTGRIRRALKASGLALIGEDGFDTFAVSLNSPEREAILGRAKSEGINLCTHFDDKLLASIDETSTEKDLEDLFFVFTGKRESLSAEEVSLIPSHARRSSTYLTEDVFRRHRSESEFLRYVKRLESKDLSLAHSMIPLGSCTMKLNATTEMTALSWPEFANLHPFVPKAQARGYQEMFKGLEKALCDVTGFKKVSLQPNAGSQGEYAGLLVIRAYQESLGEGHRKVCLIPKSAHGTNPASAVMAGLKVVVVECDTNGNVDIQDLRTKIKEHAQQLSCLMITYPSTHGVFEEEIKEITKSIHKAGGQVYMDGANLNALVGLVRPSELGMDVCHINLHKTFCIPHGGGGPGMGPIGVAPHLAPFLPEHPVIPVGHTQGIGPISSAPWGSSLILIISWAYIRLMGGKGLTDATKIAILNANYIARRLNPHYPVLYKGLNGYVAHECILDLRKFRHVSVEDVAKRLMDYGFHAPTVSWPVAGTLMIEPTESESKEELDRFCDAMIAIRDEIRAIESGEMDHLRNPLKGAPHTALEVASDNWDRPYGRERAAYPAPWTRLFKFWPSVGRIDAAHGDRNLVCTCASVADYSSVRPN